MATVCIDEEILHVYLVLLEIETAYGTEVVNDKRYKTLIRQDTDIVPELPSMGTVAWCSKLDLADDPEPVADCVAIYPEGYLQVGSVEDCCRCKFQAHDREVRQGSRFRNTFLTDAGESVVCGHEQIISADMAAGVDGGRLDLTDFARAFHSSCSSCPRPLHSRRPR